MIMSVEEFRAYVPSAAETPDVILEGKLQAAELMIRKYTNNNFQDRNRRFITGISDRAFTETYPYIKEGDTVQISESKLNNGLYLFSAQNMGLMDEEHCMVTKVVYPMDVKMGVVNLLKWDLENRGKVGIQSETISRHAVTYFNLDGDNLEISASMQQFFDATEEHGSKFLYFEDKLNRQDAFFVQEQHSLQRVEGYAVYYEKNPSMQEFLVAQNRHTEPPRVEGEAVSAKREDVAQNYRAILNKLNEKPAKKKRQPFVYVAGVAVLAVVAATGITQVGNYQNLKTLQQTLQTVSGNVQGKQQDTKNTSATAEKEAAKAGDEKTTEKTADESTDGKQSMDGQNTAQSGENGDAAQTTSENVSRKQGTDQNTDTNSDQSANQNTDTKADQNTTQNTDTKAGQNQENQGAQNQDTQSQQTSAQDVRHYTVKKGDSLMSISKAIYHDTSMIDKICSMNQIENMDMIYEGQDLILP